jgi:hypothetical protein
MRGTKAKAIRRKVYGEQSIKTKRRYSRDENGTITNTGLRRTYQLTKKAL